LYVESMNTNLIPPFILREGGLIVNDKPKILCEHPTEDDHTIKDTKTGLFNEVPIPARTCFFKQAAEVHDSPKSLEY
jgi:hypothetical protein